MLIKSINKLLRALQYSWHGIRTAWREEWAFNFECVLLILAIPMIYYISNNFLHGFILFASIVAVLICELFNSAIERAVNRISYEIHPLSGQIKDLSSAGVLLAGILALTVWGWSLINYFFAKN